MRLTGIAVVNIPPISLFEVDSLSDVVVVAGRNGVGKTRLLSNLIAFFTNPTQNNAIRLRLEATSAAEKQSWGTTTLDTSQAADAKKLRSTLQQNRRRAEWRSSVIQFESDRSIVRINPYQFSWDYSDPWEETWNWQGTLTGFRDRFQDTMQSIFRKVHSHREKIAKRAEDMWRDGEKSMPLDWPDPLQTFKSAFALLLSPKELIDPDLREQVLKYREGDQVFSIEQLSSGEREVVNIVFDFLLRNPEDCIVFFDEPELHLHPELSYRLLRTLRSVGRRNQFIFATHSPDIIASSLDQSVIFLAPRTAPATNQAIPVVDSDDTNEALRLLGQSIGIVALGKKIVLIEGATTSLDKQTYGSILREKHPDIVLVPSGGKGLITSYQNVITEVLQKTIWGVDFFMLCDHDALPASQSRDNVERESMGRLRVLNRYHLENYFLDEKILSKIFEKMEPEESKLRCPESVEILLRNIARGVSSYAAALMVSAHFRTLAGNVNIMPKNCHGLDPNQLGIAFRREAEQEHSRIGRSLDPDEVQKHATRVAAEVRSLLDAANDTWKVAIPGRPVFNSFANRVKMQPARLKQLYVNEAEQSASSPFEEIASIFAHFESVSK